MAKGLSGNGLGRARSVVLFDYDGTLADTRAGIMTCVKSVLTEWGMDEGEMGDLGRFAGPPMPYSFTDLLGFSEKDAVELTRRYRARYDQLGPEWRPLYPGMREMLGRLATAGLRLGVASSKRQEVLDRLVVEAGLDEVFEAVSGAIEPVRCHKREVILYALGLLGATAGDAVMVGDRRYDVEGAAKLGIPCVAADFGTAEPGELERAGAYAVCGDTDSLEHALLGIAGVRQG